MTTPDLARPYSPVELSLPAKRSAGRRSVRVLIYIVLIALSILTRPEGAFFLPAVVIYRWVDRAEGQTLGGYALDVALLCVPGRG